jgi:hypothetical protein
MDNPFVLMVPVSTTGEPAPGVTPQFVAIERLTDASDTVPVTVVPVVGKLPQVLVPVCVQVKVPVTPAPLCTKTALPSNTVFALTLEVAVSVQVADKSFDPPGSFELPEQPTTSAVSTAHTRIFENCFLINRFSIRVISCSDGLQRRHFHLNPSIQSADFECQSIAGKDWSRLAVR